MTVLEDLVVKLSADVKSLQDGMKLATDAVNTASDNINKSLKSTENQSKSVFDNIKSGILAVFGGNLLSSLGGKFIGVMNDAFQSARQLSRGIAEINSVLPDNQALTKSATDQFLKFSSAYGTSASAQAKAYYDIVTSGIEGTQNQMKLLAQANETATAGLIEVGTSVKILTTFLDAYAKSGATAASISDTLFTASRDAGTSFEKFSAAMQGVGPSASVAGLGLDDLAATMAFLTKQGQSVETSASQIQSVLNAVIRTTPEASSVARQLGIDFSVTALHSKGLVGFLDDIIKKTGGNTEALKALGFRQDAISGITRILNGDLSQLAKIQGDLSTKLGATEKAAGKVKESFDFKMNVAITESKNLAVALASDLLPALIRIIENLKNARDWIRYFGESMGILAKPISEMDLDEVNTKIGELTKSMENHVATLNRLQGPSASFFGSSIDKIDEEKAAIAELTAQISEYKDKAKELSPEIATVERAPALKGPGGEEIPGTPTAPGIIPPKGGGKDLDIGGRAAKEASDLALADISAQEDANKIQQENLEAGYELKLLSEEEYFAKKQALQDEQYGIEIEKNNAQYEADIKDLEDKRNEGLLSQENFLDQKSLIEENAQNKKMALLEKSSIQEQLLEKKKGEALLKLQKLETDAKLKVMDGFFNLAGALAKKGSKELFVIQQGHALVSAVVATNQAAAEALAVPPAPNIGLATLAKIAGGLNIATIAAQTVTGFAQGITEIPAGYKNDTFPANLSSGERVVDADTNSDLKEFLRSGEGGGKSTVEIAFRGDAMEMLEYSLTDRWDKGVSRLRLKGIS